MVFLILIDSENFQKGVEQKNEMGNYFSVLLTIVFTLVIVILSTWSNLESFDHLNKGE